jgi:hypothetical protein
VAALASQPDLQGVPVPKTNRNPVVSLRPAPITIRIGANEYEIPALPAADWLEIFMRPSWSPDDVLIDLAGVDVDVVLGLEMDDTDDLVTDIFEEVTARHWWIANRIIQVALDSWDIMGPEAIFNGVDADKLSLAAWLDAMLVLVLRRIKDDSASMFVAQLELPPAGEVIPEEEMAMSEDQFLSMGD